MHWQRWKRNRLFSDISSKEKDRLLWFGVILGHVKMVITLFLFIKFINFILFSSGKTKFSMASCLLYTPRDFKYRVRHRVIVAHGLQIGVVCMGFFQFYPSLHIAVVWLYKKGFLQPFLKSFITLKSFLTGNNVQMIVFISNQEVHLSLWSKEVRKVP